MSLGPFDLPITKDDRTYCLIVGGLWLALFLLPAGCATLTESGKGVDWLSRAKLAETVSMPIGDTAGDDLIKGNTSKTLALEIADNQIRELEQQVAETQANAKTVAQEIRRMEQRNAGRNLIDLSGGAVLVVVFCFAVYALDKWLGFKRIALAAGRACYLGRHLGADPIVEMRPELRRLPRRHKKSFDTELEKRGWLLPLTAQNTSD